MELAISSKSNALLANAIEVPSHSATESRDSAANQDIVSDYQFVSQETSPEHMDKGGTNQPLLGADSRMERYYHAIKVDACKPLVPKRKRKRNNLNTKPALKRKGNTLSTRSASSYVIRSVITRCSGHAEGLLTTTENADHVHQLRADGFAQQEHENFLSQENAGCGDSLGFNQDVNISNKYVHDKASVCDADRDAIKPVNLGHRKKQKLSSPRSSLSSISEDDTIADGSSKAPILEQHPTRPYLNCELSIVGILHQHP
ncbi:uncharacterized protein LOC121811040 [Salvia splendens]|uniref:uncharacterized protein LOC121811040 n=1 Tax=Salvia splendens TaxID=180675 RepID=UPI001C260B23|nr:uncharacterized protein LOC121811040 [Salvia splendens]XP_042067744.1 uncharacterized protein LOC121811040 [Salvia splendens]